MEIAFYVCLALIAYPYAGYPLLLIVLNRAFGRESHKSDPSCEPTVTVIMPVHNERTRIAAKIRNLLALDYPSSKLEILIVGDGCTDDSLVEAKAAGGRSVHVIELPERAGKAAALNAGLGRATGEIIVFTDAGIVLEAAALKLLVAHFADPEIGCVSGEDHIEGDVGEGLYGRLELLLRREEALLHSIAGASGCFYAQRRELARPFVAGMAPDFLSVLVTVASGKRALAEPKARGTMTATSSQRAEFVRKVRTLLRGMTALFGNARLLNPLSWPAFSFILWSHKVMRWGAPVPMLGCLFTAWALRGQPVFAAALYAQLALYAVSVAGLVWPRLGEKVSIVRLSSFFFLANAAALKAAALWLAGVRVEVWQPTRRPG